MGRCRASQNPGVLAWGLQLLWGLLRALALPDSWSGGRRDFGIGSGQDRAATVHLSRCSLSLTFQRGEWRLCTRVCPTGCPGSVGRQRLGLGVYGAGPRRRAESSALHPALGALPQAASQARQQHLSSLQDYMQRCTNELYWLDQQAKGRVQYDWSDRNLDYPSRRRQYEVGSEGLREGGRGRSPEATPRAAAHFSAELHQPEPGGQGGEDQQAT